MLLTDAFLLCGSHLVHGQVNPETVQSEWFVNGRYEDLAAALENGLTAERYPRRPRLPAAAHPVYRGLKRSLRGPQGPRRCGRLAGIASGPQARHGRPGPAGRSRQNRSLAATGDLLAGETATRPFSTNGLERSVKAFQIRHGLEPDGVVGVATASDLDVPASERLEQIRANLERWRWVTQDLGERYILVNVAAFRSASSKRAARFCLCPSIVGRPPTGDARVQRENDLPRDQSRPGTCRRSSLREDILPKVKKDPAYLKKMGFRVLENWTRRRSGDRTRGRRLVGRRSGEPVLQVPSGPRTAQLARADQVHVPEQVRRLSPRHARTRALQAWPRGTSARAASGSKNPSSSPTTSCGTIRPGRRRSSSSRDRHRGDAVVSPPEAAERPSPLLDGVAGRRRESPIPAGYLSQGRGPLSGVGRTGDGNGRSRPDHQVRTRPTSTWTKSEAG